MYFGIKHESLLIIELSPLSQLPVQSLISSCHLCAGTWLSCRSEIWDGTTGCWRGFTFCQCAWLMCNWDGKPYVRLHTVVLGCHHKFNLRECLGESLTIWTLYTHLQLLGEGRGRHSSPTHRILTCFSLPLPGYHNSSNSGFLSGQVTLPGYHFVLSFPV